MLSRGVLRWFSQQARHVQAGEIVAKMADLRGNIKKQEEEIVVIRKQVKDKEAETAAKNKAIHEKRIKLTEDFRKAEEFWGQAKKKSEANKFAAIQSFATGLIQLGSHFNNAKQIENAHHSTDLREGFDNTVRLFFNTLEKFNIKETELKEGEVVKKEEVEIVGKEKGEKAGAVAKVVEQGWTLEGKVIVKAKVIVYG